MKNKKNSRQGRTLKQKEAVTGDIVSALVLSDHPLFFYKLF